VSHGDGALSDEEEDDKNHDKESDASAWSVTPCAAMRPSRQGAEKYDDKDDEKDGFHDGVSQVRG
jgi:hypothetical protein